MNLMNPPTDSAVGAPDRSREALPDTTKAAADFEEDWYLERYPDVRVALATGSTRSAFDHYLQHGKREGRLPNASGRVRPIVHVHIAKTAGTSIRSAFQRSGRRVLNTGPDFTYDSAKHGDIEVFSGHFGFHAASDIGGHLVTILREPIDRFVSYYFHLAKLYESGNEVSERTRLAAKYPLEEFVKIWDCPHFVEDLFNAVVWQLAHGTRFPERLALRSETAPSDDNLLELAIRNLNAFSVVGLQEELAGFCKILALRHGVDLKTEWENTTAGRTATQDLPRRVRDKIGEWVYLDLDLYAYAKDMLYHQQQLAGCLAR